MTTVETPHQRELDTQRDLRAPDSQTPSEWADLDRARLRTLGPCELEALASRIRTFLVESVAVTGGHLGSNLGAVELTLALHRFFESPNDQIVWDTGHQAYVHKLVTGRGRDFPGLRQAGGLSGYPNRSESAHDLVENSHASTALSYAFGLARARNHQGDRHAVVAVVGDGALTGGLAYEAINNIGAAGTDVVIVLNDNGRSYAPTVSRLTVGRGTSGSTPAQSFFESLGVRYLGPIDGHDVPAIESALHEATKVPGPAVVHVLTVKGRGYEPAEQDDEKCLHDIGPFDPATGVVRPPSNTTGSNGSGHNGSGHNGSGHNGSARSSYTKAFGDALVAEASRRPDVMAITAAMGGPTGLLAFRDRFPDRFVDVGIAEQHAVTAAAGMAMGGLRPVVAIYSTFLNRAWDQIYCDVGLHRLPVIFCIDRAGVTGEDGPSHHGVLDLALLTKVPGMTVLAPSNCDEVGEMLRQALEISTGPVAIRWPKTPGSGGRTGSGLRARLLRTGSDVCLLGVGKLVDVCQAAADLLAAGGIEATVWDVRVASPLDPVMIDDAMRHPLVVTAEDGICDGGVGSKVAASIGRLARSTADPEVIPCGIPTSYLPHGRAEDILAELGLNGPGLCRTVAAALRPANRRPANRRPACPE